MSAAAFLLDQNIPLAVGRALLSEQPGPNDEHELDITPEKAEHLIDRLRRQGRVE